MPQYRPDAIDKNKDLLSLISNMAARKKCTSAQLSLAWMMAKRPYIVPIPGTRHIERMKENAGAANVHLTAEVVAEIDHALDTTPMYGVFGRN